MPSKRCQRPGCPGTILRPEFNYCLDLCRAMHSTMEKLTMRLARAEYKRDRPNGEQVVKDLIEELDHLILLDELLSAQVEMREQHYREHSRAAQEQREELRAEEYGNVHPAWRVEGAAGAGQQAGALLGSVQE